MIGLYLSLKTNYRRKTSLKCTVTEKNNAKTQCFLNFKIIIYGRKKTINIIFQYHQSHFGEARREESLAEHGLLLLDGLVLGGDGPRNIFSVDLLPVAHHWLAGSHLHILSQCCSGLHLCLCWSVHSHTNVGALREELMATESDAHIDRIVPWQSVPSIGDIVQPERLLQIVVGQDLCQLGKLRIVHRLFEDWWHIGCICHYRVVAAMRLTKDRRSSLLLLLLCPWLHKSALLHASASHQQWFIEDHL